MQIFKSLFSAQIASAVDFGLTILLSSVIGMYYVIATAIGALMGGVVNCTMNYRWVFPGMGVKKMHVAIKYAIVWVASIVLNTWGTYILTEYLRENIHVRCFLGEYVSHVYIVGKIVVAVVVAVFWNYQMYRLFVYRDVQLARFLKGSKKQI